MPSRPTPSTLSMARQRRQAPLFIVMAATLITCLAATSVSATPPATDTTLTPREAAASTRTQGIVHHLVLARLNAGVDAARAQRVRAASIDLLKGIPGVLSVTAGVKLREERPVHLRDYDIVIHVRLDSASSLDTYAGHPLHKTFLAQHGAAIARYQVLDYIETP
jgi:hypothetical protein